MVIGQKDAQIDRFYTQIESMLKEKQ